MTSCFVVLTGLVSSRSFSLFVPNPGTSPAWKDWVLRVLGQEKGSLVEREAERIGSCVGKAVSQLE